MKTDDRSGTGKQEREANLGTFPERDPNPILGISLDENIIYLNPAARKLFPTLEHDRSNHPYLIGWKEIELQLRRHPDLHIIREVEFEGRYFQQSIYYIEETQLISVYGVEVSQQKQMLAEIQDANLKLEDQAQELEIQTEELQVQSEELLTQTEDLQIANQKLQEEKRLGKAVNRINEIIHSQLKFDQIMQQAVMEAGQALGCDTAAISLKRGWKWVVSYVYGFPEEALGMVMNDRQEMHAVLAIQTRRPVAVEDAFNDRRFNREHLRKWGIRSVLVIPILTSEEAIGAIFFNYQRDVFHFEEMHIDFGLQLGSAISLALQNARLIEQLEAKLAEGEQAELALKDSEEKFRSLADSSPLLIWMTDSEGGLQFVNRAYREYFGVSLAQVEGGQWQPLVHPEDIERYTSEFFSALDEQKSFRAEVRVRRADGKWRWVESNAEPRFSPDGEFEGYAGNSQDITERKQAEGALQQRNEMLALMTDAAAELLAGADPIARLDEFFSRAGKVLGLEIYVQYNLSEDGTYLKLGKLSGIPDRYLKVLSRLELGQAVCGTVAQTRKPMYVNDVQSQTDRKTRLIRKIGIGTYACHPLIVGGRLYGTLSFGSRSRTHFDPDEIGILKTFCSLVAEALARKQTEKALKEANQLLEQRVKERMVELTHTTEALREANDLLETVFASVDMMIAYMDRDFNFLRVNRTYAKADGHEPEYYLGKNHFALFPSEENQAIFQQVVDSGQPFTVYEKPFAYEFAPERGVTYWDWSLQPVKDTNGKVQGLVLSLVNVTERVQADQAYHKGLERGAIMAEFSNAVAQVGPDYQAVLDSITRKTSELLKGSCAIRLVSKDGKNLELASFYHPNPSTQEAFYQLINAYVQPVNEGFAGKVFQSGKKLLIGEAEFNQVADTYSSTYAGYLKQLNINSAIAVALRVQGKISGVLIIFRCPPQQPLSEWELEIIQPFADRAALAISNARLYQDLQAALELEQNMRIQLIQSEKYAALTRLVASVAHELNNPIQTIKNCLYLIQNRIPEEDASRTFIDMAVSEGTRVSNLVTQLRETYRPPKENTARTFNLIELLENYRILISPHVQQNQVILSLKIPEGLTNCSINGIPDQIKQVFINIGLNAIEAMQPQGGDLRIELSLLPEEKGVQIAFRDTGPGIQPDAISQIFEPFFTTKDKGTGLGLAICYEIIQAHGGKIGVDSQLGAGSTFKIWLPTGNHDRKPQE